jgi:hypothetical protein
LKIWGSQLLLLLVVLVVVLLLVLLWLLLRDIQAPGVQEAPP